MMFWPDHDLTGWGWGPMVISMALFWALLIGGGVLLLRALNRPSGGPAPGARPSPQQLLAERFARGEIDEEEYRGRLATLISTEHVAPPLL